MFTGIVAAVGLIEAVAPIGATASPGGVRLTIAARAMGLDDVGIGDSIAIQGACMTVVAKRGEHFEVEVSAESLRLTVGLDRPGEVNLEKALRLSDRLGGHLVSGHIDGLATVSAFAPVGESHRLALLIPRDLARYMAYKGSVTVNGVSLTVNSVGDQADGAAEISINLIPHTLQATTLKDLTIGGRVNLEVDLLARYLERLTRASE